MFYFGPKCQAEGYASKLPIKECQMKEGVEGSKSLFLILIIEVHGSRKHNKPCQPRGNCLKAANGLSVNVLINIEYQWGGGGC